MSHLYETKAVNEDGVNGYSYIEGEQKIKVTSPLSKERGANPEKFAGLALATCFNSTIQAILKEDGRENKTKTEVTVQLHPEDSGQGYYFTLHAELAIDQMDLEDVEVYLEKTKERCPMSKLFKDAADVTYSVKAYS